MDLSARTSDNSDSEADLIAQLRDQVETLRRENTTLRVQRDYFKEQLDCRLRQLYAAASEQRAAAQKDLFFNEAEMWAPLTEPAVDTQAVPQSLVPRKNKPGRKPLDPALPREIVRHELPPAERVCALDGTALQEIGVEVSEQLDIVPAQIKV